MEHLRVGGDLAGLLFPDHILHPGVVSMIKTRIHFWGGREAGVARSACYFVGEHFGGVDVVQCVKDKKTTPGRGRFELSSCHVFSNFI